MAVHEIDAWPETTIKRYEDYVARQLWPSQLGHLYLAQIPYVAAKVAGGNDKLTMNDFAIRLNPIAVSSMDEDAANDAVFGKLRNRSRKRDS